MNNLFLKSFFAARFPQPCIDYPFSFIHMWFSLAFKLELHLCFFSPSLICAR